MIVTGRDLGLLNITGHSVIRLGRVAEGNDRALPHPAVSAHHAQLNLRADGQWWAEDLGSDHGVFVNGQRVGPQGRPVRLEQDTVWIPPYALRLTAQAENTPPRAAHLRLDLVNVQRRAGSRVLLDLQGAPLSFRPGEFIAIVGGSGAGKSTLLKALLGADTIQGAGRSGDVYFNNQLLIHGAETRAFEPLNVIVGYVPQQDDSLHFALTAHEALDYSARLRFASDVPAKERAARVQQALAAVKLDRPDLQNKPIAQLSGGQRKRVNVAMELVAEPRLLFLDEPTSGLDPGLDLEMMRLLKGWATGVPHSTERNALPSPGGRGGQPKVAGGDGELSDPKTIVVITHATENVRLCDYVVFMGRVSVNGAERGGCPLYFGPPGERAAEFFGRETFSEVYQLVEKDEAAGQHHLRLTTDPQWSRPLWERARTPQDIQESAALSPAELTLTAPATSARLDGRRLRRQFTILAERYAKLLARDRGAFVFQLLQGALVALLLWGVVAPDTFSIAGVRGAPKTLFIMSIAATWLGLLNATKEIVKERRVFGRERRYGVGPVPYVLSKLAVLGGLGVWQMASLLALLLWQLTPESWGGTFAPLVIEWFISMELMLLAGVALGLCLSAFARSLDQATMFMFPAMLIQVLLAGLLFDVGLAAWLAFTHWGIQALGNSLHLEDLFSAAGKASDPILDTLNLASSAFTLAGYWLVLILFVAALIALTCWRQSWSDKARIPED